MPGYYVMIKSAPSQFHFVLMADNHEVILTSETYASKQEAQSGIATCQLNSPHDRRYVKPISRANHPFFVLRAENHEVIGTSQMYSSASARDNGVASCKIHGPTMNVFDDSSS
jgi:uncharacterized protein